MADNVFIAIGSNINPRDNIQKAIIELKKFVKITAISNFYKSKSLGNPNQPDFLNGVIKIQTDYKPRDLKFEVLRKTEEKLGRVRTNDKNASRTIDLDLILYGDLIINEPDLHLPDPAIRKYPFIAIPLLELVPDLFLPDTNDSLIDEPVIKMKKDIHLEKEFSTSLKNLISIPT